MYRGIRIEIKQNLESKDKQNKEENKLVILSDIRRKKRRQSRQRERERE